MNVDTSWLSFESTTARLGVLYAASLASFLVILFLLTCTTSIELKGLRRCQLVMRFALAVVVGACFFLGAAAYRRDEPMVFPGYGVLRPLVHGTICLLTFFATTHWVIRLTVAPMFGLFIVLDSFSSELYHQELTCVRNGTCVGLHSPLWVLEALVYRDMVSIGAGIWVFMFLAYFAVSIGVFTQRINAREFSRTSLNSQIPEELRHMASQRFDVGSDGGSDGADGARSSVRRRTAASGPAYSSL